MATKIDDGGPAFPRSASEGGGTGKYGEQDGMSLRDYFAGKAMNGLLSNSDVSYSKFANLSADAYEIADAMIAARKQKDSPAT